MKLKFETGERVRITSCTDRYITNYKDYIDKEFTIESCKADGTFLDREYKEFHCPSYELEEDPNIWSWPEIDLERCEKPISITDEDYMTVFKETE